MNPNDDHGTFTVDLRDNNIRDGVHRPAPGTEVTVRGVVRPSDHLNPNPVVLVDFHPGYGNDHRAIVPLDRVEVQNPPEPTNSSAVIRVRGHATYYMNGVFVHDGDTSDPWRPVGSTTAYGYADFTTDKNARVEVLFAGEPE